MKNILDIYLEIFSDKSKWQYYSKMNINPFESDQDTKKFILQFIELSGKAEDNPLYNNIEKLDSHRIRHIVSTYFLGTYLYNNISSIKCAIDVVVDRYKKQNPYSKIEFSFLWFIICLFHDLGYAIEDYSTYKNFDDFIKGKVKYFLKKRVGVPSVYENVYENYFNYRLNSPLDFIRKPDHGICGGIILFNKLNEILIKKQRGKKTEGLSWHPKLINIYRHASWVILSHNIFFIREGETDEAIYRDNNLDELVLGREEQSKIKLDKHSFLFLFALVDSIDPIKTFDNYENLKMLKCSVDSNKITLSINNDTHRNSYFTKVTSLKNWLMSDIKVIDDRIEIQF